MNLLLLADRRSNITPEVRHKYYIPCMGLMLSLGSSFFEQTQISTSFLVFVFAGKMKMYKQTQFA